MESIIDFFSTLVSIGKKEASHGHDPFWERGNEQLMRNVIKLLDLAGERISIANIDRVIKSLPARPGEFEEARWQKDSYCGQLVASIKGRQGSLTPDQWSDLDFATQYIFRKWAEFDARPRSSLEMTWSGMADKFLFNPFNRLFSSGKCSFTSEDTTHRGRIVICDFPLLEYGHETGRLINIILKLIFQRAWLRRKLGESGNPVELEENSVYEGPALPIFRIIPGSFWMVRIVYEPVFVFALALVLTNFFILQSSAAHYLMLAAVLLAMKNYVAWYKTWEFLRNMMDLRFAGRASRSLSITRPRKTILRQFIRRASLRTCPMKSARPRLRTLRVYSGGLRPLPRSHA